MALESIKMSKKKNTFVLHEFIRTILRCKGIRMLLGNFLKGGASETERERDREIKTIIDRRPTAAVDKVLFFFAVHSSTQLSVT